jgi:hypothetical protein
MLARGTADRTGDRRNILARSARFRHSPRRETPLFVEALTHRPTRERWVRVDRRDVATSIEATGLTIGRVADGLYSGDPIDIFSPGNRIPSQL